VWRSSPIVKRVSAKVVETLKGSRYFLKGYLNQNLMEEMGDPSAYPLSIELMEMFSSGFPAKWKNHIKAFCNQIEAEKASASGNKKSKGSKSVARTMSTSHLAKSVTDPSTSCDSGDISQKEAEMTSISRNKKSKGSKSVARTRSTDHSIASDSGDTSESSNSTSFTKATRKRGKDIDF